jgi:hypothetical protein
MRTVLRPLIAVAALVALAVPTLAGAASTATVPIEHVSPHGGTIVWVATVNKAKTCTWSSSPNVAGFNATVSCQTGEVARSARFQPNRSAKAKDYMLTLTVRGETTTVDHLKVVEAVQVSIRMSIKDLSVAGAFGTYDDLLLTVNAYVGEKLATSGGLDMTSSDPEEVILCGMTFPRSGRNDYCSITFDNPGVFTITAKYQPNYWAYPPYYTASKSLVVIIRAYPTPPGSP